MFPRNLHPVLRERPNLAIEVEFAQVGADDFIGLHGGQDQKATHRG